MTRRRLENGAFAGRKFRRFADFANVTFVGPTDFSGASFPRGGTFSGAVFSDTADFGAATIGEVEFATTKFNGAAMFGDATFQAAPEFTSAKFKGDAMFTGARFERFGDFLPEIVEGQLAFNEVICEERLRIATVCGSATFDRADFREGTDVFLSTDDVSFADTDFGGTSLITGPLAGGVPRIRSLKGAKLATLTVSGADLEDCLFIGAFGLDGLQLDRVRFAQPPKRWSFRLRRQRWTRRRTLAEEHLWRRDERHGPGWMAGTGEVPAPEDVAGAYRALRKGLEDRRNEPGAADLYYGEMEMRRHSRSSASGTLSRTSSAAERGLLWGYWATSGYALRASRSLLLLLIAVVICTPAFDLYGFQDRVRPYAPVARIQPDDPKAELADFPPSPGDVVDAWGSFEAWTYSAGTAVAVIGAPDAQLTQYGRAIRIVLRILGPILLGLALLSIRGRVKR